MGFPFKWHFIYEDDDASPNENHTKKHPIWQGEATAQDDGGQRRAGLGAECPDDWLASAGGAALRSAMVMFTRTTMIREGGPKRDRSAVGAALCCPTWRPDGLVLAIPHVMSRRVAYECARMT